MSWKEPKKMSLYTKADQPQVPRAELCLPSFAERVAAFWNWFDANEPKLADMVENQARYDSEEIVGFVSAGVALVSEDLRFNMGGDFEFTFTVDGHHYLHFLLPWLTERMPHRHAAKWAFFPCMPSRRGDAVGLFMYGVSVVTDKVRVSLDYDGKKARAAVRFYSPELLTLPEKQAYSVFFILMEISIGEGLAYYYIDDVKMLREPEEDMFVLTELDQRLRTAVEASGKELMTDPTQRYATYSSAASGQALRHDIVTGMSCYMPLVNAYYNGSDELWGKFAAAGASPGFLYYRYDHEVPRSQILDERYDIMEKLEEAAKGAIDPSIAALVLGGATGHEYAYIDLILYDPPAFCEQAKRLLAEYPYRFSFVEFRPGGKAIALND